MFDSPGNLIAHAKGASYGMAGALAARLLGLLIDGVVPKQWLFVAVEAGAMTVAALWLWRSSGAEP